MKYYLDTEFHEYKKIITTEDERGVIDHEIDTIELISIGIVSEKGKKYYAICNEFDIDTAWNNEWLRENVLKTLFSSEIIITDIDNFKINIDKYGISKHQIARGIKEFCSSYNSPEKIARRLKQGSVEKLNTWVIDDNIQFYAYYGDYDWVVFCWLFGRMIDLPDGFPMYCIDLKQILDEKADLVKRKICRTQMNGIDFDQIKFIKNLNGYPKQDNEHNALDDAKWNKDLHNFLNDLR